MMPHGQESQCCKSEGGLQAPGEAAWFPKVGEEEATAAGSCPSSDLIPGAPQGEPGAAVPSPQRASSTTSSSSSGCSQSDDSPSSQEEEGPAPRQYLEDAEFLLQDALDEKMAKLVKLLLLKYLRKELISVEEMLSCVTIYYEDYFPGIFCKAFECIHLIFGIEMKQADPTGHLYGLVPALGLTCHDVLGGDQTVPKTGLLISILGLVFIGGRCVPELQIWEALSVMGLYAGSEHCIFGEPRKLITEEWVQAGYLEYRQVPQSDPARFEFLWGPRAHAETSEMRVLQYLARFNRNDPRFHPSMNQGAVGDEKESVQAADAGGAIESEVGRVEPGPGPVSCAAPCESGPVHYSHCEDSNESSD